MTSGIIVSKESAMLVINDGGLLSGGSPTSYLEGPVKKMNLDAGIPFTFPLGHEGVFAPLTLETTVSRSAAVGEYTVSYLNCPPPWPAAKATNIEQLSSQEFWTVERTAGSTDINVRLHWTDATAQGITNTDDLVVAMYNPDADQFPTFPAGWTSIGQEGLIGGVGDGVSGSIMNIGICPPPWGVELFSFASTSNSNSLPVEMESFSVKLIGETSIVEWETSNEENVDYYKIEKSLDGINFFEIDRVLDVKNTEAGGRYQVLDKNPKVGLNYYRILQADLDEMSSYTNIVSVEYNRTFNLIAYPNPVYNEVSISGDNIQSAKQINVVDATGRFLFSKKIENESQLKNMSLIDDLNISKPGVYFLELFNDGKSETVRIVKN